MRVPTPRIWRSAVVLAAMLAAGAAARPLPAQAGRPALTLELPADSLLGRHGPLVRATNMLAGDRIRELLNAGFPARFQFRVELWSAGRFFDTFEKAGEYTLLVRYLPAERVYEVTHVQDDRAFSLGRFAAVADAERAIGRAMAAPVNARAIPRRQYYQATLTVEVLSEKDIDEVARWLKGDIEPGITGKANPASVVTRGVRALATRLLGGEKAEYEATTAPFLVP